MAIAEELAALKAVVLANNYDQYNAMMKGAWPRLFYAAIADVWAAQDLDLQSYKTSPTDVTSSTTLTDVTGLSVSLAADSKYWIECIAPCGDGGGGLKFGVDGTVAILQMSMSTMLLGSGNDPVIMSLSSLGLGTISTTDLLTEPIFKLSGTLLTTDAGNFKIRFAQASSNPAPSSVNEGAVIRATLLPS